MAIAVLCVAPVTAIGSPAMARAVAPVATASVIDGKVPPIARFPWMAHVEYEVATGPWICSGTVVAPRLVLTAAHCAEDLESDALAPVSTYEVITGAADASTASNSDISSVSQVVINPSFDLKTLQGDAALLILSRPVHVPALRLASPAESALLAPETLVEIAGWGMVHQEVIVSPNFLHVGTARVRSKEYCKGGVRDFVGEPYSPVTQLCLTGAPGFQNVACYGDSGGPAVGHSPDGVPVEVGVFSLVGEECAPHYPTVYGRIDRISAWVESWITAVEDGTPPPARRVQHVHLPVLTSERAEEIFNFGKLAEALPARLRGQTAKHFACRYLGRAKVHCRVHWVRGGDFFYGHIATYFMLRGEDVLWAERYTVHWTRRGCRAGPHRSARCLVHTLKGQLSS